jgi:GT2 family glycosyltransferase
MASIVIPNWNGKRNLRDCLEAIRAQTYREFEVLLGDKASSDSSFEFVKTFFPETHVIALSQNQGFSGAANEGIKKAKGEFVALLNNDAFPGENWLKALVEGIQEAPDIGICASKVFRMTEEMRIETAGDGYLRFGGAFKVVRKPLLGKLGYFDENYFIYYSPRLVIYPLESVRACPEPATPSARIVFGGKSFRFASNESRRDILYLC